VLLRRRATQAECFDVPGRALEEVRSDYAWLARVNRLTHFDLPFRRSIPGQLGESACRDLELLDVGAGEAG
jgi:hypothetical protein